MAATFTSTAPSTSADYMKYLFDAPTKDDRDGDSILLDFTLAKTDTSFVRLSRGNYITISSDTYPIWFTGYIQNEPEYTYLGSRNNVPYWGFKYEASSDEVILSQNALGIIPPFYNMTQGAILKVLANLIAPGLFDVTNVQDGLLLARYVVNPQNKFSDVAAAFSASGVYRLYGQDHKLYFVPKSGMTQGLSVDGNDKRFTPSSFTCKGSTNVPIINDAVVVGNIEPQRYTSEYFLGTGFTGEYPLSASAFGVESVILLDDDFSGNSFDNTKWTVYDQPTNYLRLFNGYVNVVGGTGDCGDVHLDSAMLLALSGDIRLVHGEYDFVPQTTDNLVCGIIGGLWTQTPNTSFTGCVYGIRVNKAAGVVSISPIVNGVVDSTQTLSVDTNGASGNPPLFDLSLSYLIGQPVLYNGVYYECIADTAPGDLPTDSAFWALATSKRYVLRTILSTKETFRAPQQYNYRKADGSTGTYGAGVIADQVEIQTYITELDPNTGLVSEGFPVSWSNTISLTTAQVYALYVAAASNDLHVTFNDVTLSTPMQAHLGIQSNGTAGYVSKLVGPNEIDATDGLAPFATITQSGGVNQKQNVLGTPQYAFGNPQLTFFNDPSSLVSTVPQFGDVIKLVYRSAGAAIGRARSQASIALEAENWSDSGVRSVVRNGDITPIPTTSQDCEAAAAAIIGQNSFTHYEGTYEVPSENVTAEPQAGATLAFSNLPAEAFPATSFAEPIYEVVTTFDATSGGEHFTHTITYGLKGNSQRLLQTLAGFSTQSDVFLTTDSAEIPAYISVDSVGLAYGPPVKALAMDPTNNGAYLPWSANTLSALGQVILDSNNNLQRLTAIVIPVTTIALLTSQTINGLQTVLNLVSTGDVTSSVHATNIVELIGLAVNYGLNGVSAPVSLVLGSKVTLLLPTSFTGARTRLLSKLILTVPAVADTGYAVVTTPGNSLPTTGAVEPDWVSALPNKSDLVGTVLSCPSVSVSNNVLSVVGETPLQGNVNVGCALELSDFTTALALNGLTAEVLSVSGLGFQAAVQTADYATAADTGIATVTSNGTQSVLTNDGTAQWTLQGRAVGVDANNYYYDTGQDPTPAPSYVAASTLPTAGGFEVRYTDASWGCDSGKNLAGRFTNRKFSLPRVPRNNVLFVKAYDIRNWLLNSEDLTSNWSGASVVTLSPGVDPDGNVGSVSSVAFSGGVPAVGQNTGATTFTLLNVPVCFTVSIKGTAGQQVTLSVGNGSSLHGDATVTLTGEWQRVSVAYTFTSSITSALTVSITAVGTPQTVMVTRASLEVNTLTETVYCKTHSADNLLPSGFYGATSRYAASIHTLFPQLPQPPTAGLSYDDPTAPVITIIPPAVMDDVWGVEVRGADNITVVYSANLTDAGYTQQVTDSGNVSLSLTYYVYTYNVLGEYSTPFVLSAVNPYYQTDSVVGQNLLANPGFESNLLGVPVDTTRTSGQILIDDWYVK